MIARIVAEADLDAHPYFRALAEKGFDKADFVETQIQFFYAVIFFGRPMAIVAAKIPSGKQRLEILRNVWEEHGEGDVRGFHESTFLRFLERLDGVEEGEVWARALWPEVRTFNTVLTGAAVMDNFVVGVSTMGMIERMFADISSRIARGIVENGWMTSERMVHYDLHAHLDVRHSSDFFAVVRDRWELGGEMRYQVEQGLRMGAYAFTTLYEGLWRARTRRVFQRPVRREPML
ncbi:MAG: TenA family transcriptional regulator [Myxococcota bacterium]